MFKRIELLAAAALLVLLTLVGSPAMAEDAPAAPVAEAAPELFSEPFFTLKKDVAAGCSAYARCENGTTISCSTSSGSVSCRGVDQNCSAGERGYVECGWNEDQCPPCPLNCNYPPKSCRAGNVCEPGCGNCGSGTCIGGRCNCEI